MMLHIVPLSDVQEHIDSPNCPCHPEVEFVGDSIIVIHSTFNKTEDIKHVIKIPYSLS